MDKRIHELDYKDRNGVQLKEGDKVRAGTFVHGSVRWGNGIVTWDKYRYTLKGCGFGFEHIAKNCIEIIK